LVGAEVIDEQSTGLRLQGTGTSPGVVTGRVRVLRSLSDGHQLKAGEILVARATDPGWTPLFLKAGGVIMELGGMLSHGAVVAREYGLPAVVNIQGAMSRLEDGDVVTIDGRRGVVWVQ
jgi:pyruvate,water dikinase